jgi:hypothetical protein
MLPPLATPTGENEQKQIAQKSEVYLFHSISLFNFQKAVAIAKGDCFTFRNE